MRPPYRAAHSRPAYAVSRSSQGDGAPKNPNLWLRTVARHGGRLSARQSRRFQHRASLFPLEAGSNSVSSSVSQLLAGPPIGSGRSSDAAREPAVRQPARRRRYQRPASWTPHYPPSPNLTYTGHLVHL